MENNNWMNNPKLRNMDKSKLQMLISLSEQSQGKSQKELLPFLMAAASSTKGKGFTPEETELIIDVLSQGKSKEELQNIERMRNMMKMMK